MKTMLTLCFLIAISSVSGCITVSLHPVADKRVARQDDRIVGKWRPYDTAFKTFSKDAEWTIRSSRNRGYTLLINSGGKVSRYKLALVHLGKGHYFEIVRDKPAGRVLIDAIPVHHLFKVQITPKTIRVVSTIPAEQFAAIAAEHHIQFTRVDGRIVLTASTTKLQQFYREHGDKLFAETDTILKKQK